MGFDADAHLIWGIPVLAYDPDTGEASPYWDEENDDWREFEGELYVYHYGHYEDPDGPRGMLTSKRIEMLTADCWTPIPVMAYELVNESTDDKLYSKTQDQARAAGLDVSFYGDARWWLVASYG